MPRRGHSTTIGKIAKFYQDRRASEIRMLGESLRRERRTVTSEETSRRETRQETRHEFRERPEVR